MAEINRRIFHNADDMDRYATVELGDFAMEGYLMQQSIMGFARLIRSRVFFESVSSNPSSLG